MKFFFIILTLHLFVLFSYDEYLVLSKESRSKRVVAENDNEIPITSMLRVSKYAANNHKQVILRKSVAKNLVVDCRMTFSIVENSGFKRFLEDVEKRYDTNTIGR